MYTKLLVKALLFIAFVPGVLLTLPPGGSPMVVLVVHALLFVVVSGYVMKALKA